MQRRKFLIGAGSAAVGTSALVGSGAFTSVSADRNITVETANDAYSLLSMHATDSPNGEYATSETGPNGQAVITIDLSDSNPTDAGGEGVNDDATTNILEIFEIENQGTQTVTVWASGIGCEDGPTEDGHVDLVATDLPNASDVSLTGCGINGDAPGDLDDRWELGAGESMKAGLWINTTGQIAESYDITIHADADEVDSDPADSDSAPA